jgi:hypothetical protein
MPKQTLVIRISGVLARSVADFVEAGAHGYASIDEFAEVSLRNQLNLEGFEAGALPARELNEPDPLTSSTLLSVPETAPETFAEPRPPTSEELFVLTNRLGPIKIACRVLANLQAGGDAPTVEAFQEQAARAARELGLRLREQDQALTRRGSSRRSTAFPIGKSERAALDRFISSFALGSDRGVAQGPLALLGLANVLDGRVNLTEAGWSLAVAPSPLVDDAQGATISPEEAKILREQISRCPGERRAVENFLKIVRETGGVQSKVDIALQKANKAWSAEFTSSHRAAMTGRLTELGLVNVSGRGPKGQIRILEGAVLPPIDREVRDHA